MKRVIFSFSLVLMLSSRLLLAQDPVAVRDTQTTIAPSLTVAAIYGSNANYYGQTAEDRLPYLLTNGSYRLVNGIYFSVGGYRLLNNNNSTFAEIDLSAGYEADLGKGLSASFGYTRSVFGKNSPLLQAANENTLSAVFAYDWKILKSSLNSNYAFGKTNDVFVTLNNSKSMDLGSLFSDKDFISLEPGVEIATGTVQYLQEYLVRMENQSKGKSTPRYTTVTRSASTFDILSYNANILLGYNRRHYLVETGYQLSFLSSSIAATSKKPRSFFNLNLYYQF